MADLNLKFENGKAPALNADNMNRIVNEINFINERTKNAVAVAANPKVKPKYALNTIMIGDDVYLVDGNAGSTKYDLLGKQVGEDVRFFQPSENAKQIILMAIYRRCFQGSAIIDLEEKTIKATSTSVENELYNKYLGQLWDENHASQNTFTYNYNADNDDYTFYWNGIDGFGTETLVYYAFDGNVSVRSSYYELEVAVISVEKSQEIGISTWEELENKPFESLNADNFEVDEVGTLSIKDDGRIAMLENEVSDLDKNKVNQLNMSTGIDISDWDRDIDPDVPVIVDKYVNYHDAVSKLSQQIDVMGNRTDDLKTSLNNLDNIVFNIANNGYNANTDRNVLENRINAIKYVINNIMKNGNGFCGAVIRYSGGYYFHYYITRVQNSEISALEIDMYSKKIRMIQINNTSGEGTVLREI